MAGIPFIIFGALTLWGGVTGNLAAIYAALFGATDQLIQRPNTGVVSSPVGFVTESAEQGLLATTGLNVAPTIWDDIVRDLHL